MPEDYRAAISDVLRALMAAYGPSIALSKARKVAGLIVATDGAVVKLSGDPPLVLGALVNEFAQLSPHATNELVTRTLAGHPGVRLG